MKVQVYGATDLGRKRSINEDNYKICPRLSLYLIADGMGGHIAGEIASRLAVDIVTEVIQQETDKIRAGEAIDAHPGQMLSKAIQIANKKILETAQKRAELEGMGTTLIACMHTDNTLHIASVGDSRIYRFRNDSGQLLTSDHSWVNMQVHLGNITPEEARYHPMRNVITRALGTQSDVEIDISSHLVKNQDLVLMCSDGLSNFFTIDELSEILSDNKRDMENITEKLIRLANERGGDDNITVILLNFDDASLVADLDDDNEQDTEIIPKSRIYHRLSQKRFPQRPP